MVLLVAVRELDHDFHPSVGLLVLAFWFLFCCVAVREIEPRLCTC
jgi:hypothetical protein